MIKIKNKINIKRRQNYATSNHCNQQPFTRTEGASALQPLRCGAGLELRGLQALTCDEWGSGISVRFHGKLSTVMGPLGSPLVNRVECVNVYPNIKM